MALTLFAALVLAGAADAATPTTAAVSGSQVRLTSAPTGFAIEYAPGNYAAGADTYVRFRSLSSDPITVGAGCSTDAAGWVVCGNHTQSSLYISGATVADNTLIFTTAGGNTTLGSMQVYMGSGNDVVVGGPESANIDVGDGSNYVDGGAGADLIYGGNGNDVLRGGADGDNLQAAGGDNILDGGSGSDLMYAGSGNDVMNGGPGGDNLQAADGNNLLNGGAGADLEYTGAGTDVITDRDGEGDHLDCGGGTDSAPSDAIDLVYGCEALPAGTPDATPPSVGVTAPTNGQHVAEGTLTASAVTCSDTGGSSLASCFFPPSILAGRGDTTFVAVAADRAANLAFQVVRYTVDLGPLPVTATPITATPVTPLPPASRPATTPGAPKLTIDPRLPSVSPRKLVTGRRARVALGRWRPRHSFGLRFQWQSCDDKGLNCASIPGATGRSLKLDKSQAGHRLRFVVTAKVRGGSAVSTTSQPSEIVLSSTPVNTVPPRINGRPVLGKYLFAKKGIWNPRGFRIGYQWQRCDASGGGCQPIPGATRVTWRVTDADVGHTLQVIVTATSFADRSSGQAASAPTAVITG